ncbi:uncharacterized protein A4U43_C03F22440 [Asparagus officinalis]|uniref:Photosystem II repair protein PSB27-H1, chloroplastic n=1 Tax=Asparagus officinalis TaxID=4686 RepID=A0A5P1FEZ9_ASPOF|nr:photosystem II repair protein PSB27-H1, chloroplastic [Asparagus officinalis]ONK75967.1 uncharacterized protein A4U43_C03F22440 [Asparagus officinalis]
MQVSSCLVTSPPCCRCSKLPSAPPTAAKPSVVACAAQTDVPSSTALRLPPAVDSWWSPHSDIDSGGAAAGISRMAAKTYVQDTSDVIQKLRTTIGMEKADPNVATAVAELRDASNSWVAKYRREKALLGRPSFRDMYSALNAVSGHYISFGPTAPIPAKRKARILEEVDTAEKALLRGR